MRVGVGGRVCEIRRVCVCEIRRVCVCEIRRVCMCVREVGWEGPWGE